MSSTIFDLYYIQKQNAFINEKGRNKYDKRKHSINYKF